MIRGAAAVRLAGVQHEAVAAFCSAVLCCRMVRARFVLSTIPRMQFSICTKISQAVSINSAPTHTCSASATHAHTHSGHGLEERGESDSTDRVNVAPFLL